MHPYRYFRVSACIFILGPFASAPVDADHVMPRFGPCSEWRVSTHRGSARAVSRCPARLVRGRQELGRSPGRDHGQIPKFPMQCNMDTTPVGKSCRTGPIPTERYGRGSSRRPRRAKRWVRVPSPITSCVGLLSGQESSPGPCMPRCHLARIWKVVGETAIITPCEVTWWNGVWMAL